MVKTVVAVIVGLVLLNTAWFVLKIVILIVAERREYEKYRYKSPCVRCNRKIIERGYYQDFRLCSFLRPDR